MKFAVAAGLFLTAALSALGASIVGGSVTFSRDVAPILYRHCVNCHHPGDIAPMSLIAYKDVKPWAASIKESVLTRKMPPWKADPHYGKWSNNPTLSDAELAALVRWADSGKPEGDPKFLPPAPVFNEGWRAGKPDMVFTIPTFKLAAKGGDENISINVPTNFNEDVWITAAELRPGNRRVVHHAHAFVVDSPLSNVLPKINNAIAKTNARLFQVADGTLRYIRPDAPVIDNGCQVDDGGDFPGATQDDLESLLSSYLPGRDPDVYPPGTARRIPAGAKINFQIHYARSGKDETDETAVGIWISKEPPQQIARRIDLHNHMFKIPAGAASHEVSECHTFSKDLFITSLTPHMHYRGKDMKIEAAYPDGRRETLLFVPVYNFNWQITYRAASPIFLPKGTRVSIVAHFDNSVNNKMNPDPNTVVRWGSASENEMMDGWIEYVDANR